MITWILSQSVTYDDQLVRFGVSGEGPPLVVVHGTPWSSFNMRHLILELSNQFTVYYYDLLGYGQSDKSPGDVSLGIQNDVLSGLLEFWGLDNPAIIGHDFGGATVLRTHLLNGDNFSKIVLIDPVAVSPWGSPFFQHVRDHEAAFAGVPDYIHEAIIRAYIKTAAFDPIDEDLMEMIIQPWMKGDGKAAFYRQIAQADSNYTDEVEARYGEITTPTLLLWGEEDTWIPLEQGRKLNSVIKSSVLETIPDAGHLVIEEKPAELISNIRRFLL